MKSIIIFFFLCLFSISFASAGWFDGSRLFISNNIFTNKGNSSGNGTPGVNGSNGFSLVPTVLYSINGTMNLTFSYYGNNSWFSTYYFNVSGMKGDKGDKGDTGSNGGTGPQGPGGTNGTNGTNGLNGTSFSLVNISFYTNSTFAIFLYNASTLYSYGSANLSGVNGAKGADGSPGSPGSNGANGLSCILINTSYNNNGTYTFYFNSSNVLANYTTLNLTGVNGQKGADGTGGGSINGTDIWTNIFYVNFTTYLKGDTVFDGNTMIYNATNNVLRLNGSIQVNIINFTSGAFTLTDASDPIMNCSQSDNCVFSQNISAQTFIGNITAGQGSNVLTINQTGEPDLSQKVFGSWSILGSGSTFTSIFMTAPTAFGTVGHLAPDGKRYFFPLVNASSPATAGNNATKNLSAGWRTTTTQVYNWQSPKLTTVLRTGQNINNTRMWVALDSIGSSNNLSNCGQGVGLMTNAGVYGITYDNLSNQNNANWQCCTGNGTNIWFGCRDTGIKVMTDTVYSFRLNLTQNVSFTCDIMQQNGTYISTPALGNISPVTQLLSPSILVASTAMNSTEIKSIQSNGLYMEWNR